MIRGMRFWNHSYWLLNLLRPIFFLSKSALKMTNLINIAWKLSLGSQKESVAHESSSGQINYGVTITQGYAGRLDQNALPVPETST